MAAYSDLTSQQKYAVRMMLRALTASMLVNGVGDDEGDLSVVEIDFRLRNLSDVLNTSANLPHTDLIGVQDLTRRQIIEIFMAATSG